MVAFVDANKTRETDGLRWGVEPICAQLPIAPQTYYAARWRAPSVRSLRDDYLRVEVGRVFDQNFGVYGANKVWAQLNREQIRVARCTVERLMKQLGIRGAVRGKRTFTTIPAEVGGRPADLVERDFTASAPNRKWVADLIYVRTWSGFVYVAFTIDVYARMIVGWQISRRLRTDLALDALKQAIWARRRHGLQGLIHHSDRGVQGEFKRWRQHLGMMEVSDGSACWVDEGVDGSLADEVAWCAVASTGGGAEVLA